MLSRKKKGAQPKEKKKVKMILLEHLKRFAKFHYLKWEKNKKDAMIRGRGLWWWIVVQWAALITPCALNLVSAL